MAVDERPTLLIVDDDPGLQQQLRWSFDGYDTVMAGDRESAIAAFRRHQPTVVTLDLGLPPQVNSADEGIAVLETILATQPGTKVIVVSGQNERAHALRAIGLGAYDFVTKPFEADELERVVARAVRIADLETENRRLRDVTAGEIVPGLLTRDPAMLTVCAMIGRFATTSASVLLHGEIGTGKELLARALHERSGRLRRRFVAINCAAIPEPLLEAELFGYERGAFTGAVRQTPGKIEMAQGGTLFLDEIGDLPISLQAKLLRFLQQRTIERLGGREEISIDVRVVSATHRNLREAIAQGNFREDLFFRLSELVVSIPPLRERIGDAVLLAHALADRFGREMNRGRMVLRADAIAAIEAAQWSGNVRELANCLKRAVILTDGNSIGAAELGLSAAGEQPVRTLRRIREDAERSAVVQAMAVADANIVRAAEILGVSRPTLYDLLNRFGMR
jgi:two-component system NtrC family response regulator